MLLALTSTNPRKAVEMIELILTGAAVFAVGVVLGAEMNRRARSGKPLIGPFKSNTTQAPPRYNPGDRRL